MSNYLSVTDFAEKHDVSDRYIRRLCAEGKLEGAELVGKAYRIPETTELPADRRHLRGKVVADHLAPLFTAIDEKKSEVNKHRPLTEGEVVRLREEFVVDYTYNSNAIEGNALTLKETAMVLQGLTVAQKPLKDHLEAVGHRNAFLYMEELSRRKARLREHEIKSIHSLLLMDKVDNRDVYRRVPISTAGTYTEPVQPYLIQQKIEELLLNNEDRRKTMHPIERIARFHLEFERIHPFIDSNGRTGRLVMNLELIRSGYPTINVKFSDRKKYYEAFDAYYRNGSVDAMITLIVGYVSERLEQYLKILSNIE